MAEYNIIFDSVGRIEWIRTIADNIKQLTPQVVAGDQIIIHLPSEVEKLDAAHLASLACFIEYFHKKRCIMATMANPQVRTFIFDKLNWRAYWAGQV